MINKEENIKLSTKAKVLILDQSIGKIILIFLETFLAAYFYKISKQNILYLSIYNMIGFLVAIIGAFVVADFIKRKDKVKLYRFCIFVKSVYIFIIALLGDKITDYVWLIGILSGVSTATTGFPFNMIESENISIKERGKYIGYASAGMEIVVYLFQYY